MSHIFISYSRRDLNFAQKIVDALSANDLDTWIDWKSIPKGEDWEQEIYRGIEEADAFLFLISPDSVASQMCNKEIAHAVENGKRILPIRIRDTASGIPEAISKPNWIDCRDGKDDFNKAIEETRKTIHTDYEWLKYHTKLQIKALDWERGKDHSRLLRGKELREAEQQLAQISGLEDPQPTKIQKEYVLDSRRNEERQRRQITIGLSLGLIVMAILSTFAWGQRNEAKTQQATAQAASTRAVGQEAIAKANEAEAQLQARIARSGELSAQAENVAENYPQRSLLLAVEALNILPDSASNGMSAKQVLYDRVASIGGIPLGQNIADTSFSADERWFVLRNIDRTVRILDLSAQDPFGTSTVLGGRGFVAERVHFDPTGRWLIAESETRSYLWDLSLDDPFGVPIELQEPFLKFSPDGKWLVGKVNGTTSRLWDLSKIDSGATSFDIRSSDLEFTSNGHWLISQDDGVYLYDLSLPNPSTQVLDLGIKNDRIQKMALSSDGQWLAISIEHNNILIYDLSGPRPKDFTLIGLGDEILGLDFSPDGHWLAMSANGGTTYDGHKVTRLWDLSEKEIPISFSDLEGGFTSFSPNGKFLATTCSGGSTTSVWDLSTKKAVGGSFWCRYLSFSPNSQWLIIVDGRRESTLYLTDLSNNGSDRKQISVPLSTSVGTHWEISPDGNFLAIANENTAKLMYLYSDEPLANTLALQGHQGDIEILSFSPDGKWLMAVGQGNSISLWDISNIYFGVKTITLGGYESAISSIIFSAKGHWLICHSDDNNARLYDLRKTPSAVSALGLPVINQERASEPYLGRDRFVAVSPDNRWLAAGGYDNVVQLLDLSIPNPLESPRILQKHDDRVAALSFSHNGHLLVSGGLDEHIYLWDLTSSDFYNNKISLVVQNGAINFLAFSPDDKWMVSSSVDNKWQLWNLSNPGIPTSRMIGRGSTVFFSPDSQWLVTTEELSGETSIWKLTSPSLSSINFQGTKFAPDIIFSPDSRWIIVDESAPQTTWLLDLTLPDPYINSILLPKDYYWGFAFSADGHWLAAGNYDGSFLIVDLTSNQPPKYSAIWSAYDPPNVSYRESLFRQSLFFDPQGNWLATSPNDSRSLITSTEEDMTKLLRVFPSLSNLEGIDLLGTLGSFNSNENWLVTRSLDSTVRLWDLDKQNPMSSPLVLGTLDGNASSLIWSRTGKWLVGIEDPKGIKLWALDEEPVSASFTLDTVSGDSLLPKIILSSNEKWLVYDDYSFPSLWPLDSRSLIAISCRVVGRNFTQAEWQQYFPNEPYRITCPQWPAGE